MNKKENGKWNRKTNIGIIIIVFIFIGVTNMSEAGFLGFGNSIKWQEEVLLHDGTKIVVERFFNLGVKPTLESHERSALDETVSFVLPGSNKKVTWKTDFRDSEPEPNSLNLLVLDIVKGTPYIATYPAGCIAYNKWKRPNPPYIFFKYDGKDWKRIPLEEFPTEVSKVNVIVGHPPVKLLKPFYAIQQVNEQNYDIHDEVYKTIVRTPIKKMNEGCPEMIYYKGAWISPGDSIGRRMMDRMKK